MIFSNLPPSPGNPIRPKGMPVKNLKASNGRSRGRFEFLAVFVCLSLILIPTLGFVGTVMPGPIRNKTTILIPYGTNVRDVGRLLSNNGIIYNSYLFRMAAKYITYNELKSGEYEFLPKQSTSDIVLQMHDGRSVVHFFTAVEGLTTADFVSLLNDNKMLVGSVSTTPMEGSLLPETYRYSYGDKRQDLVARMQRHMQDTLYDLWEKRDTSIPLKTPQEAIIMASIIEKETGVANERPRIAGVFYNRLKRNMKLQSDPTVIYAISVTKGPLGRELQHKDMSFPSPINTYVHEGLPSQPICNPGQAALEAALHPEKNDYLYFVADGSGGHVFAKYLSEHNRNVARRRRSKN